MKVPMTMAERRVAALAYVCPECHAESRHPCYSLGVYFQARSSVHSPRKRIKGVHIERLKKVKP